MRLTRIYPRSTIKPATRTVLIPRPMTGGPPLAEGLRDVDLLEWVRAVITVLASPVAGRLSDLSRGARRDSGRPSTMGTP